jgi:DNA-directed RNA polymerase subunit M/transcription elongation factor TFIIS
MERAKSQKKGQATAPAAAENTIVKSAVAAAAPSVSVLLLTQKAEVKEVNLKTLASGTISLSALQALVKKKDGLEIIGSYKYKSLTLYLFGFLKGKAGTENKHELPPPYDTTLAFGDIIMTAALSENEWTHPVSIKSADYETFYTKAFGGFEDLDEDEEEEDEEELEEAAEEEAEADEEEEEEEEDEEEEEAVEADDEDAPVSPSKKMLKSGSAAVKGASKKARRPITAAAAAEAAGAAYSAYLHVPASEQLREEWEDAVAPAEPLRKRVLGTLTTLFKELISANEIAQLERCIYNATIRKAEERHVGKSWAHPPFIELYTMIAKMIAVNFHPNSYVKNTELFQRYKDGLVTFADICSMDSYQLFESHWKDHFIQQQLQEKRQLEGNRAMATDRFLCTRCWKRECTYYEMQTRSADEPMTIFITCVNCGKHWRQ